MKVTIELPNELLGFKSQIGMMEFIENSSRTLVLFVAETERLRGPKKPYKPDAKIIKIEK